MGESSAVFNERSIILVSLAVAVGIAVIVAWRAPRRAVDRAQRRSGATLELKDRLSAENDRRKTIFEVAGVVLLVVGAVFTYAQLQNTQKQVDISQKEQLTDRLVRTIEQIGSDRQAEQIGGMYGLRSLAADAAADGNLSFLEVLDQTVSAFIRQHAPCTPCAASPEPRPQDAVQAALYVLGNRDGTIRMNDLDQSRRNRTINLRDVDLRGADLTGLHLTHVDFRGSNLSRADITNANLRDSDLRATVLDRVIGRQSVQGGDTTKWS
jgi:hypothetical protein